jgi:hypothetical protein
MKIVYDGNIDPRSFRERFRHHFFHWFIQPEYGNPEPAIDFVLNNPGWRLSAQVHKFLNLR